MKLTFSDQQTIAQEISGLTDAASLITFKRDINSGGTMFLAELGREYNRHSRFTDIVDGQQYYQMPEDALRLTAIIASTGSWLPPLEQIPDEEAWRMMNMFQTYGLPSHYFIKGFDEIGLYPIPSQTVLDGLELVFSPKHLQLTESDFTTGTVTVINGSATVTHSATGFTPIMVGQWLETTDGTDSNWYRITEFTDNATLQLENFYQGTSGSKPFRIGQVMDMPEEFLEAPVDYAMYRHYVKRGEQQKAADFKALFDGSVDAAKDAYGQATNSQVISAEPRYRQYNPFRGDPPASISA